MERYRIYNNEMKIRLYEDEVQSLTEKANEKAAKYQRIANNKTPYGFNHQHSHLVGLVAEHASRILFEKIGESLGIKFDIESPYLDDTRDVECDLIVQGKKIEVKGIKYGSWLKYGPCVSEKQLKRIEKKADIILWCLYNEVQQEITFKGFNNVSDIAALTPELTGPEGHKISNYKVQTILKEMKTLEF